MALVITIGDCADTIRRYSAQRIGDKAHGWNNYIVFRHPPYAVDPRERIGVIRHKYEDGADVLAFKVLHLITDMEKTVKISRGKKDVTIK